jgi:DNA-binding PadR family transcriptional regulator
MGRGRPVKSAIRQNIVEILNVKGEMYGYDIYRVYREIFPSITLRSIYYHLRKGVSTGEFIVKEVRKEKGDFSWGAETEKIYYALGPKAQPKGDQRVKDYFKK